MVAAMTAVQEDMSVLEERIISAVSRGSNERPDDQSQLTSTTNACNPERKASSGSIGSFFVLDLLVPFWHHRTRKGRLRIDY